jgi:CyaY protein
MTDAEFHREAEAMLARIEEAIEASGADIECENAGDVLTLEFANGSKIIVNKQTPAHELWVAAKSGGYHYALREARWRNTQGDGELLAELARFASAQCGAPISLGHDA